VLCNKTVKERKDVRKTSFRESHQKEHSLRNKEFVDQSQDGFEGTSVRESIRDDLARMPIKDGSQNSKTVIRIYSHRVT